MSNNFAKNLAGMPRTAVQYTVLTPKMPDAVLDAWNVVDGFMDKYWWAVMLIMLLIMVVGFWSFNKNKNKNNDK